MDKTLNVAKLPSLSALDGVKEVAIDYASWEEFPDGPNTHFKIGIVDNALAIRFHVDESNPRAVNTEDHQPVWEDSCVEFFCLSQDGKRYYNFEFNSKGVCLASSRISKKVDVQPFTKEQLSQIIRKPQLNDDSWELTVLIPLSLIGVNAATQAGAEAAAQIGNNITAQAEANSHCQLKCNFYKCGDKTQHPHFLSWNPIKTESPNFHCPQFFGTIFFE